MSDVPPVSFALFAGGGGTVVAAATSALSARKLDATGPVTQCL